MAGVGGGWDHCDMRVGPGEGGMAGKMWLGLREGGIGVGSGRVRRGWSGWLAGRAGFSVGRS